VTLNYLEGHNGCYFVVLPTAIAFRANYASELKLDPYTVCRQKNVARDSNFTSTREVMFYLVLFVSFYVCLSVSYFA